MIPLVGYADRLWARPGEAVAVKVHSDGPEPYVVDLVRVGCADPNPEGPGVELREVPAGGRRSYPSRPQPYRLGSYAEVTLPARRSLKALEIALLCWPTLPGAGRQVLLSWYDGTRGLELALTPAGLELALRDGASTQVVATERPLAPRRWYRLEAVIDPAAGRVTLAQAALSEEADRAEAALPLAASAVLAELPARLLLAAGWSAAGPDGHFNGRLEAPRLTERDRLLAAWDFAQGIDTLAIHDGGPESLHGRLVNLPTRGVTGSRWSNREQCWRHAPEDYAAIHFHADDCYDCAWETDFVFEVPTGLASGVYALRLACGPHLDYVPLFVAPPRGERGNRVCVVIPTFTYLAYANNARYDFGPALQQRMADWGAYPWNPAQHPDFGLCTYNLHPDGTGICFGSARRPLLTLRPGYLTLLAPGCGSGLRHYQADSHLWSWLDHAGIGFDVVTDHQLHAEGSAALAGYDAVLTATHPEYHTAESLDAFKGYLEGGGRLAYLGGNGFYWRIAVSETIPDVVEIRRAEGGLRTWAAAPGESYHQLDGQYGGLWRRNARPPQALVGIGFSAQGTFLGSHYRRLPASFEPRYAWLFQGIEDELLGDFGLSGGGAAGYELDRVDPALGSPANITVLARSEKHAPTYMVSPEEILSHVSTVSGESREALVRADMVHYETPWGGEVFAVGSITFCGSLPWNGFDNPVARLMGNLLRRFLR